MSIRHPNTGEVILDKDKKPSTIRVRGPHSPAFKAFLLNNDRAALRGNSVDEDYALRFAVVATLGWTNIHWKGEVLEFTPENVRMLYSKCEWIGKQVGDFIKPSNFSTPISEG